MATTGSRSAPRPFHRKNGDYTRRARWLDAVHKSGVSRGAVAWAVALANRSNATAKPVWGLQTGQADAIGCSARQVRRYRAELEAAGLIEIKRGKVERTGDGRFTRVFTNIYNFVVGALVKVKKSSSNAPDADDLSNQSLTGHIQTFARKPFPKVVIVDDGWSESDFDDDSPFVLASR